MLKLSWEAFEAMFEAIAQEEKLPRIPLLADSATIEMILPLAYRKSVGTLRKRSYDDLTAGLRFAHRFGMPIVVVMLPVFLEEQRAAELRHLTIHHTEAMLVSAVPSAMASVCTCLHASSTCRSSRPPAVWSMPSKNTILPNPCSIAMSAAPKGLLNRLVTWRLTR